MKKFIAILLLLAVLAAGISVYLYSQRQTLVSNKIKSGLQALTGTEVVLEGVLVQKVADSFEAEVRVKKILIKNPAGFEKSDMAVLNNIHVIFEPLPLLSGEWRVRRIAARLQKAAILTGSDGIMNIAQMPAIEAIKNEKIPAPVIRGFYAENFEIQYSKIYYGTELQKMKKNEVYGRIDDPRILVQAPLLSIVNALNQGSLGLPRGRLQEHVRQHVDVKKAA